MEASALMMLVVQRQLFPSRPGVWPFRRQGASNLIDHTRGTKPERVAKARAGREWHDPNTALERCKATYIEQQHTRLDLGSQCVTPREGTLIFLGAGLQARTLCIKKSRQTQRMGETNDQGSRQVSPNRVRALGS